MWIKKMQRTDVIDMIAEQYGKTDLSPKMKRLLVRVHWARQWLVHS